jgi:hypothetical protein
LLYGPPGTGKSAFFSNVNMCNNVLTAGLSLASTIYALVRSVKAFDFVVTILNFVCRLANLALKSTLSRYLLDCTSHSPKYTIHTNPTTQRRRLLPPKSSLFPSEELHPFDRGYRLRFPNTFGGG